jgi:small subunit ribosomal protein S14
MAKKSSIEKEKRRERTVKLKWNKRQELRKKARDLNLSDEERAAARLALNKMPRDSAVTRLRNRCLMTGRARGFMRKFKLSRLAFRELASFGMIPGITKASW